MFPVALGANGQPPRPPTDASRTVAPASSAASAFAYPVFRVLWKWPPTATPSPPTACDQRADRRRRGDSDGVREDEGVGPSLGDPLRDLDDASRLDLALERAAERDAQRHRRPKAVLSRARHDLPCRGKRLLDGRSLVSLVERLGHAECEAHLVEPAGDESVVAVLVESETGPDHFRESRRRPRQPLLRAPSVARVADRRSSRSRWPAHRSP